ncbi:MAG: methyltransferase domain-containing protein [Acidimicrobiaceae bacterium]|jgi:SAM-dependent methyltransferase|nr:methyltransferase domain-containing protein [Acidimicrobiaceae bacterium]
MSRLFDKQKHNENQRSHFDLDTLSNPRMMAVDTPYVNRHVQRLVEHARLPAKCRVLDIGCGLGKFSIPLIDRGFDVTGLDLSPDMIQALDSNLGDRKMPLHVADIASPPQELWGQFDAVVGFFMLHHLVDLTAAFEGVRMCLRPGGTAAFLEPNAFSPLFPVQISLVRSMRWRSDYGVMRMTRRRLTNAMEAAGFDDIEHAWTGLLPPVVANRVGAGFENTLDKFPLPGPLSSFQVVAARSPK